MIHVGFFYTLFHDLKTPLISNIEEHNVAWDKQKIQPPDKEFRTWLLLKIGEFVGIRTGVHTTLHLYFSLTYFFTNQRKF